MDSIGLCACECEELCRHCLFFVLYSICLTKMDILDTFDEIKIGVCYKLDGKVLDSMPGQHNQQVIDRLTESSCTVVMYLD